ncbi:hypothetical protein M3Y95_00674400 [Aphelenchoides besseyi]|nr:hypothetical protein M3Y95_00674400 [Aphelenchoides besseyi]
MVANSTAPTKKVFSPVGKKLDLRSSSLSTATCPSTQLRQEVQSELAKSLVATPVSQPTGGTQIRLERWTVRCASCRLVIERKEALKGNVIYTLDRFWHRDHFTCQRCHQPIGYKKAEFRPDTNAKNVPICLDCYMEANHPPCVVCKKPLTERALAAFGSLYHKNCFTCTRCSSPFFDGEYYLFKGKPYDVDCYHLKKYESVFNVYVPLQSPATTAYSSDSSSTVTTSKTNEQDPVIPPEKVNDPSKAPKPVPRDSWIKSSTNVPSTPSVANPNEQKPKSS